ncbi:MAG: B12-binding domain-containing radical SAM protein [Bacteroidetes bacterium]|nr:B12-binding domain-containing radical SAM protein [Bacteroidota bacterium]
MRVCLIRPPKLMIKNAASVVSFPPLGMALIAAALKDRGHTVQVIDAAVSGDGGCHDFDASQIHGSLPAQNALVTSGLSFDAITASIHPDTELIGFSCMFSIDWVSDRALINVVSARYPHATLIAGGESATGMPQVFLTQCPGLAACVLGEGEETVTDLIDALASGRPLSTVSGIMLRSDGAYIKTQKRERMRKLDDIPVPAWEEFPVELYPRPLRRADAPNPITLPLIATRGCPFRCTFCTSPDMWGTRYYLRSPQSVADEIAMVQQRFKAGNFDFFDLTAIIKKKWILEFSQILRDRQLDILWRFPAGTRSEAIDEEVVKALSSSGCHEIIYAPESGSERVLEMIKKKVNIPNMLQSMRYAKKHGMRIYINMIIGLPGERHSDIFRTCWFLIQCARVGVNDVGLAKFRPYPGSALFDQLHEQGRISLDTDDYFVDSLFLVDSILLNKFYNPEIKSDRLYMLYYFLYLGSFYSAQCLFQFGNFRAILRDGTMYRYGANLKKDITSKLRNWTGGK